MKIINITLKSSIDTIVRAFATSNAQIRFQKGTYNITKTLYYSSNQDINLNGATLRQGGKIHNLMMSSTVPSTTKYNGVKNTKIHDGTIEGMSKYATKLNLLTLWHCDNIYIHNMRFLDGYYFHHLEINGSRNVTVENCKFLGYTSDPKADFREAIQIDFSSESAIFVHKSKSPCYDNTCCDNILIKNCEFGKSTKPSPSCAIGNHCQPYKGKHENIVIDNCDFYGYGTNKKEYAIKLIAMNDVTVKNCVADGYGGFAKVSRVTSYSYDKNGNKKPISTDDGKCNDVLFINNKSTNQTYLKRLVNYNENHQVTIK